MPLKAELEGQKPLREVCYTKEAKIATVPIALGEYTAKATLGTCLDLECGPSHIPSFYEAISASQEGSGSPLIWRLSTTMYHKLL